MVTPLAAEQDLSLLSLLDNGEAAVLQLARERGIQTVCIDEVKGRRVARLMGLIATGTLGLLVRAKTMRLLPTVAPVVAQMRAGGVRFADGLVERVLRGVGE